MLFESVSIVGVGLIGGSFGIAAKERGLVGRVVGIARREATIAEATACGAIDEGTTDVENGARNSDLVFLAPPVGQMRPLCERLAPSLRSGTVVTDAGSTKADIVHDCAPLFAPSAHFIGGHPMAGSERTGVEAARGDLFEGAVWVLTPSPDGDKAVTDKMVTLVESVGALPLLMSPEAHDAVVAVTSHLPHITAAALVHLFAAAHGENELAGQLVASGYRDSTRIAAGSAEMWRDISLANAPALTRSIDELVAQLGTVRALLVESNGDRLLAWFEAAAMVRKGQG